MASSRANFTFTFDIKYCTFRRIQPSCRKIRAWPRTDPYTTFLITIFVLILVFLNYYVSGKSTKRCAACEMLFPHRRSTTSHAPNSFKWQQGGKNACSRNMFFRWYNVLGLGQTKEPFILWTQMSRFVLTKLTDRHLLQHNCIRRFGSESSTDSYGFHPNRWE